MELKVYVLQFFFWEIFFQFIQSLGKGAKKQEVSDEWRSGCAEEKLEYALVKVCLLDMYYFSAQFQLLLDDDGDSWLLMMLSRESFYQPWVEFPVYFFTFR